MTDRYDGGPQGVLSIIGNDGGLDFKVWEVARESVKFINDSHAYYNGLYKLFLNQHLSPDYS